MHINQYPIGVICDLNDALKIFRLLLMYNILLQDFCYQNKTLKKPQDWFEDSSIVMQLSTVELWYCFKAMHNSNSHRKNKLPP